MHSVMGTVFAIMRRIRVDERAGRRSTDNKVESNAAVERMVQSDQSAHTGRAFQLRTNDIVYSSGQPSNWANGVLNKVYIITDPLFISDFLQMIFQQAGPYIGWETRHLFFAHIFPGLDYLHHLGFMHRDIKLHNLGIRASTLRAQSLLTLVQLCA